MKHITARSKGKVELNYQGFNSRNMRVWLKTNTDYERKKQQCWEEVQKAQDLCPFVISRVDVCRSFKRINPSKAPELDGIPGRTLEVCADKLADVFTDIFSLSLFQSVVPTCFKKTTIVLVPKKSKTLCLNNYRPVALTSTIMKRLVKTFFTSSLPDSLDPLQFAYRPNRSTDDAIALTLHTGSWTSSRADPRLCE